MIEVSLETYPTKLRLECGLECGLECEVRPLVPSDEAAFYKFYLGVPEEERLFIKHRATDRAVFHEWCREVDYESNLPLLVFADGEVIADGTLHQRSGGWKRHLGLVSILVRPGATERGLVRLLAKEMVNIGRHAGLTHLEAEFLGEQTRAIRAFEEAGFEELARIHKYVRDTKNRPHDYVLMGR